MVFLRHCGLRQLLGMLAVSSFLLAWAPAFATPAKEAPWLPEAAAYRLTLFLGNLQPVPWNKIEAAWTEPHSGAEIRISADERLRENSGHAAEPVVAAIASRDRQSMFQTATRLIAERILEELDRAVATTDPARAQRAAQEARGLYRALEDGVEAADPAAARKIGRAWLQLTSSLGSAGVLGAGTMDPRPEGATEARRVIEDYVTANYLPETFRPRETLSPTPESALVAETGPLPPRLPPGAVIRDQDPLPRLVLNFEEQGIAESDLPLIAYGDMLFDSTQIFGSPASDVGIACSACHNRSDINNRLFIPGASHQPGAVDVDGGYFNPMFNDRRYDPLDIPSLRGLRFTGPYGRDGRFASLRDFTRNVIVNEFGGDEPTPFMLDALVAYLTEFDFLPNSKLTPDGRLTNQASVAAHRGERLFKKPFPGMDGRSCASCHQPSGNFLDRQAHDIGSVAPAYVGARSGALDTPTLLGAKFTAPYFHDGSLPTLAAVVDWFDETKSLGLSASEREDLTAYLEAVGDADEPYEAFDAERTTFRLAFDELTTFASTLDTLLPAQDAEHVLLLVDTVAADLAADASTMSNLGARPDVYDLARILEEVGAGVRDGDWSAAEAAWGRFKTRSQDITGGAF